DDLIRRMPPALVRCHVVVDSSSPEHRATESHNDWTTTTGSPQGGWEGWSPAGSTAPLRLIHPDIDLITNTAEFSKSSA
ncbi:hypothetical protein, partial [Mycobacteroides abscessus]|uniref:hypothetical protein n=1 Tax=Mycobacteroides abscessus TaxID=36809 RepID=UPI0021063A24